VIVRFNRQAKQALAGKVDEKATLQSFLDEHRFSAFFARHYILPMGGHLVIVPARDAAFPVAAVFALL
jgi:predicted NAD/FAD-binding protein